MRGPAEDHRRVLSVRELQWGRRSCGNGSRGVVCVNKEPEVAGVLQWKRVICRYLLFRNWAYAMMACKREIGRLE